MAILDIFSTYTAWAASDWANGLLSGPFFAETSNNNNTSTLSPTISPTNFLLPPSSSPSSSSSYLSGELGRNPHGSNALRTRVHVAHGVLASLTMVILFPSVAIVLRVVTSRHIVQLHAIMQLVNMGILLLAFAFGIWLSWLDGRLWHYPHQILGTIIIVLFLLQPALGYMQHQRYQRTGTRTLYSPAHVWYGRLLICAGIINGGLGLRLAHRTAPRWIAAYVVVTLVVLAAYVAAQWWYRVKVRRGFAARVVETRRVGKDENRLDNGDDSRMA